MKSSTSAVFTRQNPFMPDPPLGKAHYNPSRTQKLPKQQRKTALSPVRHTQPSSPPPPQTHPLSPEEQRFLGASNRFVLCHPPATDAHPSFSESWPSTDLGSSPANNTPSPKTEALTEVTAEESLISGGPADQQDSVLAKYIERFRHGQPQSREERQQMAAGVGERQQPFWWLSTSPLPSSSTPTQSSHKDFSTLTSDHAATTLSPVGHPRRGTTLSPCGGLLDLSARDLSDSFHGDLGDPEILQLQERASRLLQRSEHSLSSGSVPISSEGLGCSDFSSPVSVDEPVRRPIIPSLMVNPKMPSLHADPVPKPSGPRRPEEDILFQWRLRRKMEQARQWPPSLSQQGPPSLSQQGPQSLSQQGPSSHQSPLLSWQGHKCVLSAERSRRVTPAFTPAPQETKTAPSPSPPPPTSSPTVSKLQSDAAVPAHMHHLCDILPCPVRPSPPSPRQKSPRRRAASGPGVAPGQSTAPASSTDTPTEENAGKREPSPPPASPESTVEGWVVHQTTAEGKNKGALQRKQVEKTESGPGASYRKKKKSVRYHGGGGDHAERPIYADKSTAADHRKRGPDRVAPWSKETGRDAGQQGSAREGRPGDGAPPPPSPIHRALGQVISGVLFPTPDSPPASKTPVSSDSSRYSPPAPPQSPAPPASVQEPTEVISQLLQAAIDSDETEFEDDPLLQVLRKQRKWVKEQIREVDAMLDEFQEE